MWCCVWDWNRLPCSSMCFTRETAEDVFISGLELFSRAESEFWSELCACCQHPPAWYKEWSSLEAEILPFYYLYFYLKSLLLLIRLNYLKHTLSNQSFHFVRQTKSFIEWFWLIKVCLLIEILEDGLLMRPRFFSLVVMQGDLNKQWIAVSAITFERLKRKTIILWLIWLLSLHCHPADAKFISFCKCEGKFSYWYHSLQTWTRLILACNTISRPVRKILVIL